jgi:hypothetical protein
LGVILGVALVVALVAVYVHLESGLTVATEDKGLGAKRLADIPRVSGSYSIEQQLEDIKRHLKHTAGDYATLRKIALETYGNVCVLCGKAQPAHRVVFAGQTPYETSTRRYRRARDTGWPEGFLRPCCRSCFNREKHHAAGRGLDQWHERPDPEALAVANARQRIKDNPFAGMRKLDPDAPDLELRLDELADGAAEDWDVT